MTKKEFLSNVESLFSGYENNRNIIFYIKTNIKLKIWNRRFSLQLHSTSTTSVVLLYTSIRCNNYETYLDELTIFKELILPKYL